MYIMTPRIRVMFPTGPTLFVMAVTSLAIVFQDCARLRTRNWKEKKGERSRSASWCCLNRRFRSDSLWLWRWLPHGLSKRQSLSTTTVLFRTKFTRTVKLNLLLKYLSDIRQNFEKSHYLLHFSYLRRNCHDQRQEKAAKTKADDIKNRESVSSL